MKHHKKSAGKKGHLIKNEHHEIQVSSPEIKLLAPPKALLAPLPPPPVAPRKSSRLNTPFSTKTFAISQLSVLFISLIFLGGFYFVLNFGVVAQTNLAEYIPVTSKPTTFNLEIKNPEDELLTFSKSVVVSGKTSAKSTVIISVEGTNTTTFDGFEVNSSGDFQKTVGLSPGLQTIEISSFDPSGSYKTVTRTVYYSEEQLQ